MNIPAFEGPKEGLNELYIRYVRANLNFMVEETGNEFPVMSRVITKAGIATRKQLDLLEEEGHIKSVTIEVPSVLVPSKTVPEKAYYTEDSVPILCQNSAPEPKDKAKLDLLNS